VSENVTRKDDPPNPTKATIATPSTLLEELVERTGMSSLQVAVGVGLVLIVLAVGAAYVDGLLIELFDSILWRNVMLYPAIFVYNLLVLPILRRLRNVAIRSFRPLVATGDDDFHRLLAGASLFDRRREWLALSLSAVVGAMLSRSWSSYYPPVLTLYFMGAGALGLGTTGWFIYSSLSGTRLFSQLQRYFVHVNVFDLKPLEPIGRWSLGIALFFIGGTTLSLLLIAQHVFILETVVIYVPLVLVPVSVFFLNMWSTHRVIVEAKDRELARTRASLETVYEALNDRAAKGDMDDTSELLSSFSAWVTVETRVRAVPEWPYTHSILRSLVASALAPILVATVGGVLLELLLRLLSPAG
jgi:hypothetical protein